MSEENMYVGMAEGIAGNGAASLRSPEAQAAISWKELKLKLLPRIQKL